jgi:cobalt-zinc-cadmium efflux system membrane fusion protein
LDVDPDKRAEVNAFIGGNVKDILVFHGDKVNKGDVLAILEHPNYIELQEEMVRVASTLEYLEQEYDRQKELFDNDVGSGRDYQKIKAEYNSLKSRYQGLIVRLDMLNLNYKDILAGNISRTISLKSPISGFVNDINVKIGAYVDERNKLFEIADNSHLHLDILIYEKDVNLVKVGQIVHFTVASNLNEEFTAEIFVIGKELEKDKRAIHVHGHVKNQPDYFFPGMYISGHIHTDEERTMALPVDAVISEGTKSYIFIEDSDHTSESDDEEIALEMIEVITGMKDEGFIEIKLLDSLPEATKVVYNAAYYLYADLNNESSGHDH